MNTRPAVVLHKLPKTLSADVGASAFLCVWQGVGASAVA